jgi:hypothetical protein
VPLIDRKLRLHRVVPKRGERLVYCDHVERDGEGLFRLACENDLEGIVAKRRDEPCLSQHNNWLKIGNQNYSQWVWREELFERERETDPEVRLWEGCVAACAVAGLDSLTEQYSSEQWRCGVFDADNQVPGEITSRRCSSLCEQLIPCSQALQGAKSKSFRNNRCFLDPPHS